MKSLVVLTTIVYLVSNADSKTIAMKNSDTGCIARYLLNNNVISASDMENFVIDDSAENCVEKINLANKEFFRQLSKKSTGDKKMDSCIIRTLERNNVTNLMS